MSHTTYTISQYAAFLRSHGYMDTELLDEIIATFGSVNRTVVEPPSSALAADSQPHDDPFGLDIDELPAPHLLDAQARAMDTEPQK